MTYQEVADKNAKKKEKNAIREEFLALETEVKNLNKRLSKMKKNGGDAILSEPENKKKIDEQKQKLASECGGKDYKGNLNAKKGFIEFQIQLLQEGAAEKEKTDAKTQEALDKLLPIIDNLSGTVEYKKQMVDEQGDLLLHDATFVSGGGKASDSDKKAVDSAKTILKKRIDECEAIKKKTEEAIKAAAAKAMKLPKLELENLGSMSAMKAMESAAKTLSELPQTMMDKFNEIKNILYTLVHGFGELLPNIPVVSIEAQIDTMISSLQSMLDPVFNTATAISLPLPPVVAPIKDILAMIPNLGKDPPGVTPDQKALIEKIKALKPEIPSTWMDSVNSMMLSVMEVMTLFPVCLINLIFGMIDAIVGQILALGGAAPYPLSLLPQAISLMPKLIPLMTTLPQTLFQIMKKKLQDEFAKMMALGQSMDMSSVGTTLGIMPASPENLVKQVQDEMKGELEKAQAERTKQLEAEYERRKKKIEEMNADMEKFQAEQDAQHEATLEKAKSLSWFPSITSSADAGSFLGFGDGPKAREAKEKYAEEHNERLKAEFQKAAQTIAPNNTPVVSESTSGEEGQGG